MPSNLGSLARSQLPKSNTKSNPSVDVCDGAETSGSENSDTETSEPDDDDWITENNFDEKAMTNFGLGGKIAYANLFDGVWLYFS